MLKVAKFGGSSVAGAEQFRKVKTIVEADESRRIIVISAAGKRSGDDHKLTDLLYLIHAHLTYGVPCDDILKTVETRLLEIRDELEIPVDISGELKAFEKKLNKETSVDEIVSRGEYFTSKLMASYLGYSFVDAADCIFFALDGTLDRETTDAAIAEALEKYGRIVIPGFYGQLPTGRLRVMSRGGSEPMSRESSWRTRALSRIRRRLKRSPLPSCESSPSWAPPSCTRNPSSRSRRRASP